MCKLAGYIADLMFHGKVGTHVFSPYGAFISTSKNFASSAVPLVVYQQSMSGLVAKSTGKRRTDRWMDRQTDGQTDRPSVTWTDGRTDAEVHQEDSPSEQQAPRQTGRCTAIANTQQTLNQIDKHFIPIQIPCGRHYSLAMH